MRAIILLSLVGSVPGRMACGLEIDLATSLQSTAQLQAADASPQTKTVAAIHNRRSTLLGEKGYGLGVCGTWEFYAGGTSR